MPAKSRYNMGGKEGAAPEDLSPCANPVTNIVYSKFPPISDNEAIGIIASLSPPFARRQTIMNNLSHAIDALIAYAREKLGLSARNAIYARNAVLGLVGAQSYEGSGAVYDGREVSDLLGDLVHACAEAGLPAAEQPERLTDGVMGALMLSPEAVEEAFAAHMRVSSAEATRWLYDYCVHADYVKKKKLDANPRFTAENGLIVTINCAKPEFRDPKKAASGNSVRGGYPACTICRENEGFVGRNKCTLRTVSLELGGEPWFWQFSPYGYFHEHGIAVNQKHIPMHVDRDTFVRLMQFVDLFPHYFIGCNAPLPRIGGSVLAHDHYQGGGEVLPLQRAPIAVPLSHPDFPEIRAGVIDWQGTAVRLSGKNADQIADLSERVREAWCAYEDAARGLIPVDGDGVHHAVSPTVIKTQNGYEMNLILRSNITSAQYPDGVFHAHPEFHVIKKESIGLIEAQGLFILPGRLVHELADLEALLISGAPLPEQYADYAMLFAEMKAMSPAFTPQSAHEAVKTELASVCSRILKNTAVFETPSDTAQFLIHKAGFTYGK